MDATPERPEHDRDRSPSPLLQVWPSFLDHVDTDREQALRQLHGFIHRLLAAFPPGIFAALRHEDREEMPGRLLVHLCDGDFRRLRSYHPRGIPFAHWVLCIAGNMARDMIDRDRLEGGRGLPLPRVPREHEDVSPATLRGPSPVSPERAVLSSRLLDRVVDVIKSMDRKCQLLLLGSAHGLSPKELAWLLGWPASWNAKVSDDRRYCRGKLRELLLKEGLDLDGAG